MTFTTIRLTSLTLFLFSIITACTPVAPAQTTQAVDSIEKWSLFVGENPKECWAQAALDNARLTVFSKPSEGINEQVVFNAEVLISRARLRVDGGTIFRLRSQEQTAWPKSASQDALVVRALKSGSVAVVTARRLNGGATRYVFSLDGATEAIGNATSRCTI